MKERGGGDRGDRDDEVTVDVVVSARTLGDVGEGNVVFGKVVVGVVEDEEEEEDEEGEEEDGDEETLIIA